jgi:L-seryl-tRNA(Ser) seleniumtransferase
MRKIPSVDALLRSNPGRRASATLGRPVLKRTLNLVLETVRRDASRGIAPPQPDEIVARAAGLASWATTGLTRVINATGVILHTGLGRAPIPERAAGAAARAATGYGDLEVARETGARTPRSARAELLLASITGAEAALVVNNGAAALLLCLASLARGKRVPVSRGELIEIGGEFRIPDILSASGAKLVEVGTTNRTRLSDYRAAVNEGVGLVLKVHQSNYRLVGFTAAPSAPALAGLAHAAGVPFVYDLGSGLLDRYPGVPDDEPAVVEALGDGADLVVFSGDKLLGGPQAGIILGRGELVARLRRHPIARAVRIDKMQVAALESVLHTYATGRRAELPVWRMLQEPADEVHHRASRLAEELDGELANAFVVRTHSTVGGGSLPGHTIPSWAVRLRVPDAQATAARLRTGSPAVFCRVEDDAVLFDLRTVTESELPDLCRAIQYAREGGDLEDD